MFSFFKKTFHRIYTSITGRLSSFFARPTLDAEAQKELERILLEADTGVRMTKTIISRIQQALAQGTIKTGQDSQKVIHEVLLESGQHVKEMPKNASIYLLVGVNGSGKTTCAAKLAHYFHAQGKKTLLVAADTFRAAAPEQLASWAQTTGATIVQGVTGQEPASVVFTGCEEFSKGHHDIMIIDTAGRLQTKINLMRELEKIRRIIEKKAPQAITCTLLTIDAMLGQNSLEQARLFHESTPLNGIILTKMDGTGKGGIVFAIMHELKISIAFMTYGEKLEDMAPFNLSEYITSLLNS